MDDAGAVHIEHMAESIAHVVVILIAPPGVLVGLYPVVHAVIYDVRVRLLQFFLLLLRENAVAEPNALDFVHFHQRLERVLRLKERHKRDVQIAQALAVLEGGDAGGVSAVELQPDEIIARGDR